MHCCLNRHQSRNQGLARSGMVYRCTKARVHFARIHFAVVAFRQRCSPGPSRTPTSWPRRSSQTGFTVNVGMQGEATFGTSLALLKKEIVWMSLRDLAYKGMSEDRANLNKIRKALLKEIGFSLISFAAARSSWTGHFSLPRMARHKTKFRRENGQESWTPLSRRLRSRTVYSLRNTRNTKNKYWFQLVTIIRHGD